MTPLARLHALKSRIATRLRVVKSSIAKYASTPVAIKSGDVPIVICCVVSGVCDAASYAAWQTFIAAQTGNMVFVCLGAFTLPSQSSYGWARALISIASFICGCIIWAQTRYWGPLTRGTLCASFLLQAVMITVAAILVQVNVAPLSTPSTGSRDYFISATFLERIPVALLSFQSAAQMVHAEQLGVTEVPTTVLTSVIKGVCADPKLLQKDNLGRNRRIAAIAAFVAGAFIGGALVSSHVGIVGALWLSAAIKYVIGIAWMLWTAESD